MRALFLKDFRQGRPVLVAAFLLALLAPATFHVLVSPRFLYLASAKDVALGFGVILLALPSVLAFLSAAGLFSTEAEHDTLPVLFALPLDRSQIWAAKVLAGFALTVVASAILLGMDVFLMPKEFRELRPLLWAFFPDMALWAFFLFSVGVLCSTIMPNLIASIALTIVLGGGLFAGVVALLMAAGAPLLGYPPELDLALWAFFTAPTLLVVSALVVTKGQLLQSRRKYLIAFPALLIGLAVTVAVVSGVTRAATRYQRSAIAWVTQEKAMVGGRRVVEVTARTAVKQFAQARFSRLRQLVFPDEYRQFPGQFMRGHSIALDLHTGKELSVLPTPNTVDGGTDAEVAVSPDGSRAAWLGRPTGLTYGRLGWRPPVLRIWDLQKRTITHQREFEEWKDQSVPSLSLSWSPTGKYLLIGVADPSELYIMRADGSGWQSISVGYETLPSGRRRPLRIKSCEWAPHEDALVALSSRDDLYRVYPDGRSPKGFYTPEWTEETYQSQVKGVSADGQWVALTEHQSTGEGNKAVSEDRLVVVRADGAGSQVIWSGSDQDEERANIRPLAWSSKGQTLYAAVTRAKSRAEQGLNWRNRWYEPAMYAWSPGQDRLQRIGPTIAYRVTEFRPVPGSEEVLVWALDPKEYPEGYDEFGRIAESGQAFLVSPQGRTREVEFDGGSQKLVKEYVPLGFDDQSRLIVEARKGDCLRALDLNTGEMERIYP